MHAHGRRIQHCIRSVGWGIQARGSVFFAEVWQRGVPHGLAVQVVRQWSVMLHALSENTYMAGALLSAPPASAGLCHLACLASAMPLV